MNIMLNTLYTVIVGTRTCILQTKKWEPKMAFVVAEYLFPWSWL